MGGDLDRTPRETMSFRCPKVLRDWLDEQVTAGEFSTYSEAIVYYLTTAKARRENCDKK